MVSLIIKINHKGLLRLKELFNHSSVSTTGVSSTDLTALLVVFFTDTVSTALSDSRLFLVIWSFFLDRHSPGTIRYNWRYRHWVH